MNLYTRLLTRLLALLPACLFAQVKDSIKVLIIYGSKPAAGYEGVEPRWFGGTRGGHAAIQIGPDKVLSFRSTKYPCHIFSKGKKERRASIFEYRTVHGAWETFPPHNYIIDSMKRAEIVIPINAAQRAKLDSLAAVYTSQAPYDYAVFGTRCASAAYDVLQQLGGIVTPHKHGNWLHIFTVRRLRKKLFKAVDKHKAEGWLRRIYPGGKSRKWEGDFYL